MGKIVLELQKDALDPNIDTATLLRKAYLVSKKLKLSEFEEWIKNELDGYSTIESIPIYRKVWGELKAWNHYNGWIPVLITDEKIHELLNKQLVHDSIPSLISLQKSNGNPCISLSGAITNALYNITNAPFQTKYAVFFGRNSVDSIIESVKNKILDWAILLEENEILGEGLVFSPEEKERVIHIPQIVNYVTNFYSSANDIQIQQGTNDSEQLQIE